MAGHNKWTQIKRQKAVTDSKKSKVFSKCSKIIALAARLGADPAMNFELRTAIDKAKAENMPRDIIERAIAKGSGAGEGGQLESARTTRVLPFSTLAPLVRKLGRYEAYGPGRTAVIIDVITDSKNRTVAEIKHLLAEHNAKFAEQGSVLWAFDITAQKVTPKITVELSPADKEALGKLVEALAENDDAQEVYTNAMD